MESSAASLPIDLSSLEEHNESANRLITAVSWTAKQSNAARETSSSAWRESIVGEGKAEELSLMRSARKFNPLSILLGEGANYVLTAVWEGLRVGIHMSRTYTRFSGLDQLISLNSKGGLAEQQKAEFRGKYITASGITIFCSAYYIVWKLSQYRSEELSAIKPELPPIPEVNLQNPVRALDCMIFYYAALLEKSGRVANDLDMAAYTLAYFRAIIDEVKLREESLLYSQPFISQVYKLENSEFAIKGFEIELEGAASRIEFNRVELGQIVGNRAAKHEARRLAERLVCYDVKAKKNPFFELGGLAPITLGYGEPGTGKSMLIAALATLLDTYCRDLKIPFLFWPMPDTVVSTFQGGSAERMMNWMRPLRDASKIIYAPIDDAENNFEERTRQGVSAGVREVIGVFLRNTEGAYAINRGNALIQLFTNIPEQIDKAVLSRINGRIYIGGAQNYHDFIDQDYLWLNRHRSIDPDFVNQKDAGDYSYLSSQSALRSLSDSRSESPEPKQSRIRELIESAHQKHSPDEHAFFGALFAAVKKEFKYFTSRDLRNIQRAVDSRLMDFDLPVEWFENPEVFFGQEYDCKREMILELMRANMKGLLLAEIRLQEAIIYLDNMITIAETGRERRIGEMVDEMRMRLAAQERLEGER